MGIQVQWVKRLLYNHEDLSLIPVTHVESLGMTQMSAPRAGEAEQSSPTGTMPAFRERWGHM